MGWHREDDSTRRALRTQTRYHNVLTYVPCAICGEKFQLDLATVTLCEGERELGSVCPTCVKAGPTGAAERAQQHADRLRQWADEHDRLATALQFVEQWVTIDELDRRRGEARGQRTHSGTWHTTGIETLWA